MNIPAALPAALPALFHELDKVIMMGESPARYPTDSFDETDPFKNVGTIAPTNTRASVPPAYSAFDTTSTLVEDNDRDIEMGQLPPALRKLNMRVARLGQTAMREMRQEEIPPSTHVSKTSDSPAGFAGFAPLMTIQCDPSCFTGPASLSAAVCFSG